MRHAASVLMVLVLLPSAARGQPAPPPLPRVDVAAATGWFVADRSLMGDGCCSSWSSSLFKGLSGGYYWTEHLKTEVELAAPGTTEGHTVRSEQVAVNRFRYISEAHRVSAHRLSLSQAYQFGHNSTFHPFVRAGVDIDREDDEIESRISTGNAFEQQHSVSTDTRARPFAGAGFKAYFNERAFFKGEARFTAAHGSLKQMAWTAGVGIDLGGGRRSTRKAAGPAAPASSLTARAPEPLDRWREYAARLPAGERVDVTTAGGARMVADLVAVDGSGITVKPVVRIAEPTRRIPFEQLEQLGLHIGPAPGTRVGATIVGAGTGLGVFTVLLMITFALLGD